MNMALSQYILISMFFRISSHWKLAGALTVSDILLINLTQRNVTSIIRLHVFRYPDFGITWLV